MRVYTDWEERLARELVLEGIPQPERQFKAIPGRQFAFDLAFPEWKVLVEVQGGIWLPQTGHTSGQGLMRDIEKTTLAQLHGYIIVLVSPDHIKNGLAHKWIRAALEMKGWKK